VRTGLECSVPFAGALQAESREDGDLTALAESVQQQIGPLLDELKAMRAREARH